MVRITLPEEIYQAGGAIKNGTLHGRWHFSFDEYYDPAFIHQPVSNTAPSALRIAS